MSILNPIKTVLQRLRVGRMRESDLDHEVSFHVEMEAEELIRQGVSKDEARRQAMLKFGGVEQVKEDCRDVLAVRWLEDLKSDVQYGWRTLVRNRAFTIVAVLTLALGIGANSAIFSVVDAVVLRRFSFPDAERLVVVWEENAEQAVEREECAPGNFVLWTEQCESFESMGLFISFMSHSRNFLLRGDGADLRVRGWHTTSGLFHALGVEPLIGRTFLPDEDTSAGTRTAVLSHAFWQRQFGGDPEVLGKTFDVGEVYTIVGVMPAGFRIPESADFWLCAAPWMSPQRLQDHRWHAAWVIGRLAEGVTPEAAQQELSRIQGNIAREYPDQHRVANAVTVVPFRDQMIGRATRPALLVLLSAVAFVLLIACANVANLTLARSSSRRKEFAVRASLGAGRLRVVRQLLTESLLLSLLGAGCGLLVAHWGVDALLSLRPDDFSQSISEIRTDRFSDVSLSWTVLGFTLAVSIVTGVAFGLIPALQTARIDVNSVVKEEGRGGTTGRAARRLADGIIVGEVALALVLLIGAAQMLLTFSQMRGRDTGLNPDSVLCAEIDTGVAAQVYPGEPADITDEISRRIASIAGVRSVGAMDHFPLRQTAWDGTFFTEGREVTDSLPSVRIQVVAPNTIETLGIPLIRGRDVTEHDRSDAPYVVLVNEEFVRRYFPDEEVLGQRIRMREFHPWSEIVGVVGNVRNHSVESSEYPEIFCSYRQATWTGEELGPILVVRTEGEPLDMVNAIRDRVEGDRAGAILKDLKTVDGILAASSSRERFLTLVLGFFTLVAVSLAAVGVYGVISYSTSQRTREIGIRLALGAQPMEICRMIVGRGLLLGVTGTLIGFAASLAVSRVVSSQLHGIEEAGVGLAGSAAGFLLVVVAAASYFPARRAMNVEPSVAIRHI